MRARLAALALLASACVTTWRFQRVEGEVASIHPELWTQVKCTGLEARGADGGCAASFAPVVTCEVTPGHCARPPGGGAAVACAHLEPLLSFVQLSDVKLREHAVLVTEDSSPALPAVLDQLYRTDDAVLLATVLGANQVGLSGKPLGDCPAISPPRFAIHTGNAVGLGLFSELTQFLAAMNELAIPWFNVVGPNDVAFLGSSPNEAVSGANAVVPFVPIGDVDRFMNFHAVRGVRADVTLPNPAQRGRDDGPNQAGCRRESSGACVPDGGFPRGLFHGFNANCETLDAGLTQLESKLDTLCTSARGYYTLTVPSTRPDTSFRIVVLNSAENVIDDGTTGTRGGRMLPEQLRWLGRELTGLPPGMFALVFAHHPLKEFDPATRAELTRLLGAQPRMLGYFHGGEGDTFFTHARDAGTGWPELGAASLLDFPQLARAVEVLRAPDGRLYVRVASFQQGQTGGPLPEASIGDGGTECEQLAQGTSFCRRLGSRASRGFQASERLAADPASARSSSQLNANGLIVAYQPDGGTNHE